MTNHNVYICKYVFLYEPIDNFFYEVTMSTACAYRLKVALLFKCKHCYANKKLLCFKKL